jgi:hypothetical protein
MKGLRDGVKKTAKGRDYFAYSRNIHPFGGKRAEPKDASRASASECGGGAENVAPGTNI